ncbi:MAG: hypothetical protein JWQ00_2818 [Noviherbaspirillum sp.]|jgi:hypothetical protein|nr:hypothetical protein [Noviherbaspirillum sp.]
MIARRAASLQHMNNQSKIRLSGPFEVVDSSGRMWEIEGIHIFDEGYGIIDVYVDLASSMEDDPLYEDTLLISQIIARLRSLGYVGPDFGHADLGLQDDKLIVLEAPEAFNAFAAARGWRNLAEGYDDDNDKQASSGDITLDSDSLAVFKGLMRKLNVK